jgi:hypothetical protein
MHDLRLRGAGPRDAAINFGGLDWVTSSYF